MFGKKLSEYVHFQRWILILIVVVFALRFGLSLAGAPMSLTRWASVTVVLLIGFLYYSVAVHIRGFGSYAQLLGLLLIQNIVAEWLVALGIIIGIVTGQDNIFTIPEVSGGGDGKTWIHVVAHVAGAVIVAPIFWLPGALILFVTRKLKPRA